MGIQYICLTYNVVTLHARVWIEIAMLSTRAVSKAVTLHARVWIEILATVCTP